jgi:2-dehydro-3-deoxyphosphogluconate aldolase / (4S)-4-hydroxy-2-oxoglutarate aldolase
MKKAEVCQRIREIGIIPAVRVSSAEDAHFAVDAVTSGGIPIVEITMTVPEAVELISHLVQYHPQVMVGAGTVLNVEVANRCCGAGVAFLTSTGLNRKLIEFAAKNDIAVLPGALTPTEVIEAWEAGSDFVKVFPCAQVGGETYIRALNRALPQIPLIASGGVNQHTAANFILAGATAIGLGTELIPPEAIERREADRIRELAKRFTNFVKDARNRLTPKAKEKPKAKTDFWKFHAP